MRLLLLGPPGAGKGTLGRKLSSHYGVPHVAAGDLIRDHIARETEFGRRIEKQIAEGNFAPDADIIYWVCRRLNQSDALSGCILDGFPRDVVQAQAFAASSPPLNVVVELQISETDLLARLAGRRVCPQCGRVYHEVQRPPKREGFCDAHEIALVRRADDDSDAVKQRLKVYERMTMPLRELYSAQELLLSIDASADAAQVFAGAARQVEEFGRRRKSALAEV